MRGEIARQAIVGGASFVATGVAAGAFFFFFLAEWRPRLYHSVTNCRYCCCCCDIIVTGESKTHTHSTAESVIADFQPAGEKIIPGIQWFVTKNVLFFVYRKHAGPGTPARHFPHADSRLLVDIHYVSAAEDHSVRPPGCFGRPAAYLAHDESVIVEKLLFGGH